LSGAKRKLRQPLTELCAVNLGFHGGKKRSEALYIVEEQIRTEVRDKRLSVSIIERQIWIRKRMLSFQKSIVQKKRLALRIRCFFIERIKLKKAEYSLSEVCGLSTFILTDDEQLLL